MSLVTITPTTLEHMELLAKTMRIEDICEIRKFGLSVTKAIRNSVKSTLRPQTVMIDGELAALFGCSGPPLGTVGEPWLLTAPICDKYPLPFALFYRQEVKKMLIDFPILENIVDANHPKAVKLLEIIGFKVYNDPSLKNGFMKFRMVAE